MIKISVLMPAYNTEKYISKAIESILMQTHSNFEFIIIDDRSTDRTWQIIKSYAKKDKRIRAYQNKANRGYTFGLNCAYRLSKGTLLARMDADDISQPTRFKKQVKAIQKGNDVIGSDVYLINEQGKTINKRGYATNNLDEKIRVESPLAHPSVMFKRELMDKYGAYNMSFTPADDYDLFLRFYSKGAKFHIIEEPLLLYRMHEKQIKNTKTRLTLINTIRVKANAARKYGVRFGLKANIRRLLEICLLCLPSSLVLFLFKLYSKQKARRK